MDQGNEALAARVAALERRARVQRGAAAACLALVAGAALARGQGASPVPAAEVRARRFVLVGADGRPLAALEATADGAPRLSLVSADGIARAALALAADGSPSISLADAAGRQRLLLEARGDEALVSVAGAGRSRAVLANGALAPRLTLADAAGNDRLWVALRLGSPALQFLDERGAARSGLTTFNDDAGVAVVSSTTPPTPGLVLHGKDRNVVWSAP